jgi:hypothetical protein
MKYTDPKAWEKGVAFLNQILAFQGNKRGACRALNILTVLLPTEKRNLRGLRTLCRLDVWLTNNCGKQTLEIIDDWVISKTGRPLPEGVSTDIWQRRSGNYSNSKLRRKGVDPKCVSAPQK